MTRYEGVFAETTSFLGHNGDQVEAYFARPLGPGPFPGIVICHPRNSWDYLHKLLTYLLAYEGYASICPNLYTREAPDAAPDEAAKIIGRRGGIPDEQAVGDAGGARDFLRSLPYCSGRIGIIGQGLGGRLAYLSACQIGFDAAVVAYGRSIVTPYDPGRTCEVSTEVVAAMHPVLPLDVTEGLAGPMLSVVGTEDPYSTPEVLDIIATAMNRHQKRYEVQRFEGAGHHFMDPFDTTYRVAASNDAWGRFLGFFVRELTAHS